MNRAVVRKIKGTPFNRFCKWWSKNGHIVMKIAFFPIWGCICARRKISVWLDSRQVWNEKKANRILNYYIPRVSQWVAKDKALYFQDRGDGWSNHYILECIKRRHRRFWKCNIVQFGGNIRKYLIDKFELEGFEKKVLDCRGSMAKICFKLIEK